MKEKYLQLFFEYPEKEFYVRQLSKKFNKAPTTISNHMKKLAEENVLKSERKYNHLLFKANTENEKYKKLKLNYNLGILSESGLIDYLVEQFNYPEAIVLFGSFAKVENTASSDVDLLIVSPSDKEVNLEKYEEKLGHEIQLFVYSNKEIKKLKEENKKLLNNFINGITIHGTFEIFK